MAKKVSVILAIFFGSFFLVTTEARGCGWDEWADWGACDCSVQPVADLVRQIRCRNNAGSCNVTCPQGPEGTQTQTLSCTGNCTQATTTFSGVTLTQTSTTISPTTTASGILLTTSDPSTTVGVQSTSYTTNLSAFTTQQITEIHATDTTATTVPPTTMIVSPTTVDALQSTTTVSSSTTTIPLDTITKSPSTTKLPTTTSIETATDFSMSTAQTTKKIAAVTTSAASSNQATTDMGTSYQRITTLTSDLRFTLSPTTITSLAQPTPSTLVVFNKNTLPPSSTPGVDIPAGTVSASQSQTLQTSYTTKQYAITDPFTLPPLLPTESQDTTLKPQERVDSSTISDPVIMTEDVMVKLGSRSVYQLPSTFVSHECHLDGRDAELFTLSLGGSLEMRADNLPADDYRIDIACPETRFALSLKVTANDTTTPEAAKIKSANKLLAPIIAPIAALLLLAGLVTTLVIRKRIKNGQRIHDIEKDVKDPSGDTEGPSPSAPSSTANT